MEKCEKVAAMFVATLKAMVIISQHAHWISKGDAFYAKHLMFERMYNTNQENLDAAAEKFIGLFEANFMDYTFQTELLNKVLSKYNGLASDEMNIEIQKDFINFCKDSYNCFEKEGKLTLGLDDFIMKASSDSEANLYLLNQSAL